MVVSLHKNLNELEATKLTLKNGNFYVAYILEKVTLLCPTKASCIWPPSTSFTFTPAYCLLAAWTSLFLRPAPVSLQVLLLFPRRTNLDIPSILKSRDITLPTKVHTVKAMVFPVVMYGCESWTIKKAEHRRIDAFELWCWVRLLRVPWTARRSRKSTLNIHWKD